MYNYHMMTDDLAEATPQINFEQCIKVGNYLMSSALIIMTLCLLISFVFDQ
jgi:hypothetical protein